ncbi:hypothetical protein KC334_g14465 [Hortaea werneckii]|nr:hypothetical protein KC334_g14465 [Hortaea werneckii]
MYFRAALTVVAVVAAVAVAEPIPVAKQLEKKQDNCTESSTSVDASPTYSGPPGPPYYGPLHWANLPGSKLVWKQNNSNLDFDFQGYCDRQHYFQFQFDSKSCHGQSDELKHANWSWVVQFPISHGYRERTELDDSIGYGHCRANCAIPIVFH